jgi:hypothetical protein
VCFGSTTVCCGSGDSAVRFDSSQPSPSLYPPQHTTQCPFTTFPIARHTTAIGSKMASQTSAPDWGDASDVDQPMAIESCAPDKKAKRRRTLAIESCAPDCELCGKGCMSRELWLLHMHTQHGQRLTKTEKVLPWCAVDGVHTQPMAGSPSRSDSHSRSAGPGCSRSRSARSRGPGRSHSPIPIARSRGPGRSRSRSRSCDGGDGDSDGDGGGDAGGDAGGGGDGGDDRWRGLPPPPLPPYRAREWPCGLWFGHVDLEDVDGPEVLGRYIAARKRLQELGRQVKSLPCSDAECGTQG